jgi:hypothetical protein
LAEHIPYLKINLLVQFDLHQPKIFQFFGELCHGSPAVIGIVSNGPANGNQWCGPHPAIFALNPASVGIRTELYMAVCFCCLSPTQALWRRGDPRQDVAVFSVSLFLLLQLAGGAYLSYYVDTGRQPTGWPAQRSLRWRTPNGLLDREPDSASHVARLLERPHTKSRGYAFVND